MDNQIDNQIDWQTNKCMEDTNLYMLENSIACDVSFTVGMNEATAREIKAHKFILISRNPVFYAMFVNKNSQTSKDEITIPDVEPEAFKSLLRYLYSGDCCLTLDNVLSILYISKKYIVSKLTEKCKLFLEGNINLENVCLIYEQSTFYDEKDLMKKCKLFLENKTEEVITCTSFLSISEKALENILNLNCVSVSEIDLYKACVKWGESECRRIGLDPHEVENMKTVLNNLLRCIHFPVMSLKEFAEISKAGLLSPEDRCRIFEYLAFSEDGKEYFPCSLNYPLTKRMKPEPFVLTRFTQFCKSNVYSGDCSMMRMSCDKNIFLKGFGISGSSDFDSLQEVQIAIKHDRMFLLNKTYFVSDEMKNQEIRVMLGTEIQFQSKTLYSIIITFNFSGEHDQGICRRGKGSSKEISLGDYTFEFDRPDSGGLISEIIFGNMANE